MFVSYHRQTTLLTVPDVRLEPPFLQLVMWAPTGNALAIVVGNDIWYRAEALGKTERLTSTGRRDTIYNGVPDWVYEGKTQHQHIPGDSFPKLLTAN